MQIRLYEILRILGVVSWFLLLAGAAPANAALMSANDPVFGAGAITSDTDTGLDWLDVPFSNGRTFLDVAGEFGPGGDFEGFRHATGTEVLGLYASAGIPDIETGSAANIPFVQALIALVGATDSQAGNPETFGFVSDVFVGPVRFNGNLDFFFQADPMGAIAMYNATVFLGTARNESIMFPGVGHWLVRVTAVDEPATLALMTLGLVLIGSSRRRSA